MYAIRSYYAAVARELGALVADAELVAAAEGAAADAGIASVLDLFGRARAESAVSGPRLRELGDYAALRRAEAVARARGWVV